MPTNPNRSSCFGEPRATSAAEHRLLASARRKPGHRDALSRRPGLLLTISALALAMALPGAIPAEDGSPEPEEVAAETAGDTAEVQTPAPPPRAMLSDEDRNQIHRVLSGGRAYRARVQAAIMLGRRGTVADDLPALRRALRDDSHYTVRGAAAMAIGNLGSPRGLEPLMAAAGDHHSFVRRAVAGAMEELAKDEAAVPYLLLAREREAKHVRLVAVSALGRLDSPAARVALVEFLGDREAEVLSAVEQAIASWERTEVVHALAEGLGHPSSFHIRANAARIAENYPDPRLVDALVERLVATLEEPRVEVAARRSLLAMRDHLDVEELVKRVQGIPDRDVRIRALVLLGIRGGDRAVDVLLRTLSDPDIRIRYYTVMALGEAGDPRAAPALLRMQDDPNNARIRGTIISALEDLSRVAATN